MSPASSGVANEIEAISSEAPNVEQFEDRINPLDLLIVVAEHKKWIAKVTAGITLLAALVVFLMPNCYTATTRILPPQQNQSLATALTGQLAAMGPLAAAAGKDLGLKNPSDLYIGMLKSETVENALVQRFDLMKVYRDSRKSDAREHLEKAATIIAGKEGFITVSVEDKDRKRAAAMANAYVTELQKMTQGVALTEAGQRRLFFEQQVNQAKENLANAEQAFKETQQKTGIIQLDGQSKAIIDSVAQVRAEIAAKQVQLQAMRSFGTEHNPDVFVANQELAGLEAQLNKLEQQQNAGGGDLQVPTGKIPELGLEYFRRARDVKYCESIFELLAKQYEVAKLDEAKQGTVIQVIDPASEPDKKSSPKRALIILVVGLLAFLGASAWVLFAASLRQLQEEQPEQQQRITRLKKSLTISFR
jgi:uncharacterized protein involved in exopolysaccharide biosynthesis